MNLLLCCSSLFCVCTCVWEEVYPSALWFTSFLLVDTCALLQKVCIHDPLFCHIHTKRLTKYPRNSIFSFLLSFLLLFLHTWTPFSLIESLSQMNILLHNKLVFQNFPFFFSCRYHHTCYLYMHASLCMYVYIHLLHMFPTMTRIFSCKFFLYFLLFRKIGYA